MLPCENILAGRVPDIHMLLPDIGLAIVGEVFLPIELHLVAPHGWSLDEITRVHSHPVALKQVQRFLDAHGLSPVAESNTATAAALIKQRGDRRAAAVASSLAAETYGLAILKRNIEDIPFNLTRFYVLAAEPVIPPPEQQDEGEEGVPHGGTCARPAPTERVRLSAELRLRGQRRGRA